MRKITPDQFIVYRLDELELPGARQRAIEQVAEKLGGDWWDQSDDDDISSIIEYALAEALGVPGHEEQAICAVDIPEVTLDGWDLQRGSYLTLRGTLTRENAPSLPWADGVVEVQLTSGYGRDFTMIDVVTDEDQLDPHSELDLTVARERCRELADVVERAVEEAVDTAISAGRTELDHKTSLEYAEEDIDANEREFYPDGTLYTGL